MLVKSVSYRDRATHAQMKNATAESQMSVVLMGWTKSNPIFEFKDNWTSRSRKKEEYG
jgi:hypothetical protein